MISLGEDGWDSDILFRTIIAIVNQKKIHTRKLIYKMHELFKEVYGENEDSKDACRVYRESG